MVACQIEAKNKLISCFLEICFPLRSQLGLQQPRSLCSGNYEYPASKLKQWPVSLKVNYAICVWELGLWSEPGFKLPEAKLGENEDKLN